MTKGFKAFRKGLVCRDKLYKVGETYEEDGKAICSEGVMHFCENPFDVLNYYDLIDEDGNLAEFAEVEALGHIFKDEREKDSKRGTNKLHIKAALSLGGFIKAGIDFLLNLTKDKQDANDQNYAKIGSSGHSAKIGSSGHYAKIGSSGDSAKIGSSGHYAQIGSSGDSAQIGSSGHSAQIGSSGDSAKIGSSGHSAKIGSSGHYAKIGSSGDSAKIGSSGHSAKIGSSGHYAKIGSSGDSAKITSEGKNSVVCCAGNNCIARAKIGSWITLAEWKWINDVYTPVCVKTIKIDGKKYKEDTFYRLENKKIQEVK